MTASRATITDMKLAIDTGGTFTDVVVRHADGLLTLHKAPTTPRDPIEGILEAIRRAAADGGLSAGELLSRCDTVIHGTTRATNAILTGTAAKTAFLTTAGHPDVLVFRMGGRELPFEHAREYPDPYVPRSLTFEIDERMDYLGEVVRPLDAASLDAVIDQLVALGIEAAGVCLLWSVSNPAHELASAGRCASARRGSPSRFRTSSTRSCASTTAHQRPASTPR